MSKIDLIQSDGYYNCIYSHAFDYFSGDMDELDEFMSSFVRWYSLDYHIYRGICLLVIEHFEGRVNV
jgi:hypothetical protein